MGVSSPASLLTGGQASRQADRQAGRRSGRQRAELRVMFSSFTKRGRLFLHHLQFGLTPSVSVSTNQPSTQRVGQPTGRYTNEWRNGSFQSSSHFTSSTIRRPRRFRERTEFQQDRVRSQRLCSSSVRRGIDPIPMLQLHRYEFLMASCLRRGGIVCER